MGRMADSMIWLINTSTQALGYDFLNARRAALPVPLPAIERQGFVKVRPASAAAQLDRRQASRAQVPAALDPVARAGALVEETVTCEDCHQPFVYKRPVGWKTKRRFCDSCKRKRDRESCRKQAARRKGRRR